MVEQRAEDKYDVSIILNAHHEGRAMQPTVRSLALCIDRALKHDLSVELIIVIDKPDELTRRYVKQALKSLIGRGVSIVIHEVNFGDLGLSRNYGIDLAQGQYVGVVDADDLFAENLITSCIATIKRSKKPVIVHPEYVISFGAKDEIIHLESSTQPDFDKAGIVEHNPWCSLSFAPKTLRQQFKYRPTRVGDGFGPEDWQWNIETLGAGIGHVVASGTAYFYRRKIAGSLATAHETSRSLLYKTDLLRRTALVSFPPLLTAEEKIKRPVKHKPKTLAQRLSIAPRFVLAGTGRIFGPAFRRHKRTQAFEHYMRIAFRELFSTSVEPAPPSIDASPPKLPEWMVAEWRRQHAFDHMLFPDKELLLNLYECKLEVTAYTALYWKLLNEVQLDADYIFLVPWLKTGGADLVVLNYINAIVKDSPSAKITVLATEVADSPWKEKLPKSTVFLTLDEAFYRLGSADQSRLLGTLLVQAAPKHIHLVNSPAGYRALAVYAKQWSVSSRLFVSVFSVDHLASGKRVHYLLDYLSDAIDYVQRVLTDNTHIIDDLVLWLAMPREKFSINYQPYPGSIIKQYEEPKPSTKLNPLKVLWAGRLDREKHPDILIKIATETRRLGLPIVFHVWGSQVLSKDNTVERLQKCDGITYHGGFSNGIGSLPLSDYDLFLLTSEYEGMPNVLLEAVAGGLPVMAPMVGGIPELVTKQTGYPIATFDNVEEYIGMLEWIVKNRLDLHKRLKHAQELVERRHSWPAFLATLRAEEGYFN